MDELDETIHQSTRLRIMAALVPLATEEKMDFRSLAELLDVTDGNLGAHLAKLEEARYVKIEKTFVARKPRTYISITTRGRAAFEEHVAALQEIVKASRRRSGS